MTHSAFFLDSFSPPVIYAKLEEKFSNEPILALESAVVNEFGNFSYFCIGAKEQIICKDGTSTYIDEKQNETILKENVFDFCKNYYNKLDKNQYILKCKELGLGFVDGFVGFLGFEIMNQIEPVLKETTLGLKDDLNLPDMKLIRPKLIIAYSHKSGIVTLIAHDSEYANLLNSIQATLMSSFEHKPLQKAVLNGEPTYSLNKDEFCKVVDDFKEHIKAGDVFQILPSCRISYPAIVKPLDFYRILRTKNPSPYMYILKMGDYTIAGSSPELMTRVNQDKEVLIKPIAGTRKRGATIEKDLAMQEEMLNDPKERSEHIMLVDLARNDIGRVCKAGSIKVTELMRVEKYSHVMHMVSDVVGILDDDKDQFDLMKATFTAGTMTGAPKIKAMELIAKAEGVKRGFYSGCIGYFGFDGSMDFAITIRTSLITKDKIVFQAGAGVVADSKPELEWLEVSNKLAANTSSFFDLLNIK